jgi:hypothetical protein
VKDEDTVQNQGCFTRQTLETLWDAPEYAEMQDELLSLMQEFSLCYPLRGRKDTYIAPQILPIAKPNYDWDETDNLIMRYRYPFMPKGLLAPFIVGMHQLIEQNQRLVWLTGVILTDGNARAEVIESEYNREIQIRITGRSKRSLLDRIRQKFWEIHQSYNDRLQQQEFIPCNCTECQDSPAPYLYELDSLERRLQKGRKSTVSCDQSYEDVDIRRLIDIFPKIDPTEQGGRLGFDGATHYHIYGDLVEGDKSGNDMIRGDKIDGDKRINEI